jgi:hypothetical protein
MPCQRCLADPQPADFGDPRQCAFDDAGNFTPENWNCATIEQLVNEFYVRELECSDESAQIIPVQDDEWGGSRGWIILTRYKHRGKTSSALHVGDFWPAKPLTLGLAEETIASYALVTAKD